MEDQEKKSSEQITKEQLLQKGKDALGSLEEEPKAKSSAKEPFIMDERFNEFIDKANFFANSQPTPTSPPPVAQQSESNALIFLIIVIIIVIAALADA